MLVGAEAALGLTLAPTRDSDYPEFRRLGPSN